MKRQVILFRLASKDFALPVQVVSEVLKGIRCSRMPQVPPHIAGVIPYQNEILPVVDLKLRLGLGFGHADTLLVIRLPGGTFGILVDAILGVKEISAEAIARNSDPRLPYVYGTAGTVILLDLPALFGQGKRLSLV